MAAVLWRERAQRKSAREGESEGGRRGDTRVLGYGAAGREAARGAELGRASAMAGRAPVHGVHEDNLSSTWRAPELTWWGANLGHFRAESVLGPKMKFAHLGLLYVSHLRCLII